MKAQKTVTVIARIEFKSDSRKVCYLVRSSNGEDQYETCLYNGKACSCSCKARTRCKHMDAVEAKEQERTRKAALAAAQAESAELLARIDAEVQADLAQAAQVPAMRTISEQAAIATLDTPKAVTPISPAGTSQIIPLTKAQNPSTIATNMVVESKRRQAAPLAGASREFRMMR